MPPDNLLERPNPAQINTWLSRFVTEARKQNGEPYPPRTMHQILAGLQRHMLEISPNAAKFLDTNNTAFRELQGTCDTVYRQLHSQGIGTAVKHTATFTAEEEEKLWSTAWGDVYSDTKELAESCILLCRKALLYQGR